MGKPKIKAIETQYAGCRFRSRLEARWAVFLDHAGIEWRYEEEGFETPHGWYLPDFYLPKPGAWLEIKGGSFTAKDRMRAQHVADRQYAERGDRFRVLRGDIPRPGTRMSLPIRGMHEVPALLVLTRALATDVVRARAAAGQQETSWECDPESPREWVHAPWLGAWDTAEKLDAALLAARSARFEHGERG